MSWSTFSLDNEGIPVSSSFQSPLHQQLCGRIFCMVHPTRFGRDTLTPERSRTFEDQVARYVVTFQVLRTLQLRGQVHVSGTLLVWPRGKSARCQGQCRCCRWQRASVVLPGMPLRPAIALRVSIRPSPTMVCIAGFQEFTLQCSVLSAQICLPNFPGYGDETMQCINLLF